MGNEAKCTVRFGKNPSQGKARLETREILLRGDFRLRIPFASIESAKAAEGELRLETANGLAVFELGPAAEKWRDKIHHPKSRIEKIGVKRGTRVSLVETFDEEFLMELKPLASPSLTGKFRKDTDTIFSAAETQKGLSEVAKLAKSLKGAAALRIVYPRGQESITERDVIAAGRQTGLKDVKVVGFSSTHTALKLVLPIDRR